MRRFSPSDLQSSDLFLFGTKETNTVIAKFATNKLPFHLDPKAEGYGLVYVYSVNGHYFLVGSGTPWFALMDPAPRIPGGRGAAPAGAGRGGRAPGGAGFARRIFRSESTFSPRRNAR